MKTRNGFVSNSSSSSFVVAGNIANVSRVMLNLVIKDYSEEDGYPLKTKTRKGEINTYDKWKNNLEIGLRKKDVKNGKIGITMPSCNYGTYIWRQNDNTCLVNTCNNHNWAEVLDIGRDRYYEGEIDFDFKGNNFFNVRNKLIHSAPISALDNEKIRTKLCSKCGRQSYCQYVIDQKGNKRCVHCFVGFIEKIDEKFVKLQIKLNQSFPDPISQLEI